VYPDVEPANAATPAIPFWPMVFKNTQLFFLGSDDFRPEVKAAAARDINAALEAGLVRLPR
jgi:NADPH2:quinone reductase